MPQFTADLDPDTKRPRLHCNFGNGWTASMVLRQLANQPEGAYDAAMVAAWPTGNEDAFESGPTELSSDEAIDWIFEISSRPQHKGVPA